MLANGQGEEILPAEIDMNKVKSSSIWLENIFFSPKVLEAFSFEDETCSYFQIFQQEEENKFYSPRDLNIHSRAAITRKIQKSWSPICKGRNASTWNFQSIYIYSFASFFLQNAEYFFTWLGSLVMAIMGSLWTSQNELKECMAQALV